MENTFENEYVIFTKKNDFLYVVYKPATEISLEAAIKVAEDRIAFSENIPQYIIADVSNIKSSSKEAREYLSQKDGGMKDIIAGAFVSNKVYSYFILNLFLKIVNPDVPAKFFSNFEDAEIWISNLRSSDLSKLQQT
jgi:hypothetical protein